ncbi:helix-turn-helix domain-containing protein [Azospirillum sp. B4]|uniref:helix-turn-helix domain-containing protein n=1 Tax=Azospirillum sp. B4 TaxID=95605 RepID=UPI00131F0886|nr:helix-turn-helix domain-containing protein [Azospirillum sp. B4]
MTQTAIPSIAIVPGTQPPEELFWRWRQCISPYFESVPLADPRNPPQAPDIRLFNVGPFLYFDTKFSRQKFVRNAAWHRQNDDVDHLALQYFLSGSNQVENGAKEYAIQAGGTYAVNFGYEIDAACSDAEILTVVLPRSALMEHLPQLATARGELFAPGSMAGRLFGDFMLSLRRNLPIATPADTDLLYNTLLGMLSVLHANGDPAARDSRRGALQSLRRHIDENLGDAALDVAALCARFRMSRATVYRLFEDLGGVRTYILRRRLTASFRALTEPAGMTRGVFDIAMDYGFTSASHFAARFREAFGMSPSEVREAARALHAKGEPALRPTSGDLSDTELMVRWTRELRR